MTSPASEGLTSEQLEPAKQWLRPKLLKVLSCESNPHGIVLKSIYDSYTSFESIRSHTYPPLCRLLKGSRPGTLFFVRETAEASARCWVRGECLWVPYIPDALNRRKSASARLCVMGECPWVPYLPGGYNRHPSRRDTFLYISPAGLPEWRTLKEEYFKLLPEDGAQDPPSHKKRRGPRKSDTPRSALLFTTEGSNDVFGDSTHVPPTTAVLPFSQIYGPRIEMVEQAAAVSDGTLGDVDQAGKVVVVALRLPGIAGGDIILGDEDWNNVKWEVALGYRSSGE